MAYDPTAYARKKAEAKEKADKLKSERDARKSELDAQAAERKAAMDALKAGNKPPPPSTSSLPSASSIAAPSISRVPAPAPALSRPANGIGGGDNSELLIKIQALEKEVQLLKERDQARQQDYDHLLKLVMRLESDSKNRPLSEEKSIKIPTAATATTAPTLPSLPKPTPKSEAPASPSLPKPAASIATPGKPFEPKPKTPAPAPPPAEPKLSSPSKASPRPDQDLPLATSKITEMEDTPEQTAELDELPVGGGGGASEFPEAAEDAGPLMTCSGCERTFNAKAMKTHAKICKKVFQTKRKAFKVELIDPEQMDDFRPPKKQPEKKKEEDPDKVPKWKQQTDQLRAALKAGRELQKALAEGVALKDIPVAAVPTQADDRITCPHCSRKFAETTAERHIPACKASKALKKK